MRRRPARSDVKAMAMCMENEIPVIVFNLNTEGNVKRAVCGVDIGTRVEVGPGNEEL